MSVYPIPGPTAAPPPKVPLPMGDVAAPSPAPQLTANPYGIADRIVADGARSEARRQLDAFRAAAHGVWNAAIGDDLSTAADASQGVGSRLLHGGLAAAAVLTLPAAPEAFGLKLVGKAILKGGAEQLTFHATGEAAAKGGRLVLEAGCALKPAEEKVAAEFAARGHVVVAKAASGVGKSADFIIDGRATELKTISHVKTESVGNAVMRTIKDATKQAKHVVIDARDQRGLSESEARKAVRTVVDSLPRARVARVEFLGRDGNRFYRFTVDK